MGALVDASRFLELSLLGTVVYVAYGYRSGHELDSLALALFLAGCLAVVLLTLQFADDFAHEED